MLSLRLGLRFIWLGGHVTLHFSSQCSAQFKVVLNSNNVCVNSRKSWQAPIDVIAMGTPITRLWFMSIEAAIINSDYNYKTDKQTSLSQHLLVNF